MCAVLFLAAGIASAAYTITAVPSSTTIDVGSCGLYFTVTVKQNGKPVSGVSVGVDDPIREACVVAGKTDQQGQVKYYPEGYCPAKYNCKVGLYKFTFSAGGNSATSQITVNRSNPGGLNRLMVANSSASTYKVQLTVNGVDKGTTTINPHSSVNLLSNGTYGTSSITATVKNSSGSTLWKAAYTATPSYSPQPTSFLNPKYTNYYVNTAVRLFTNTTNRALHGVGQVYKDVANKQWSLGGYSVTASDTVTHGVTSSGSIGFTLPTIGTFVGDQVSCGLTCGASVGLQMCIGAGAGWDIGPANVGCNVGCCVTVAAAYANVFDASVSAQAKYQQL